MEKIKSFREGRMWLNVFKSPNDEYVLTIKKSYPAGNGQWKYTDLINPDRGDLENLQTLFARFKIFKEDNEVEVISPPSFLVHSVVEYLKRSDFDLESDEVLDAGLMNILAGFDIILELSRSEYYQILDELLVLAEQNEIKEALIKTNEIMPTDTGVIYFREHQDNYQEKATAYSVPYSYPVDKNLRDVGRRKPSCVHLSK